MATNYEELNKRIDQIVIDTKEKDLRKRIEGLSSVIAEIHDIRCNLILGYEALKESERRVLYEKMSLIDKHYEDLMEVRRVEDIEFLRKEIRKKYEKDILNNERKIK